MNKSKVICFLSLMLAALPVSAGEPVRIPLVRGLVETAANKTAKGDVEQVMTVTSASEKFVDFSVEFRSVEKGRRVSHTRVRRVRREDLLASNKQNWIFQPGDAQMFPGSALIHLSASSLAELKAKGKVAMVVGTSKHEASFDDLPAILDVMSGRKYFRGTFERVGKNAVPMKVVVNGKSVGLPAIRAKGLLSVAGDSINVEIWVLDDPGNPMILRIAGDNGSRQTIRIDFPAAQPQASVLQQSLATGACRAELNGIYFDFGKATLLPQSAPALGAVADLMAKNPAWNLRIEGHTDNIGGGAYNLDLSRRRAAAVSLALSTQYRISAARLNASGLGAGKPVANNETLEGRAANRRVELARTCP